MVPGGLDPSERPIRQRRRRTRRRALVASRPRILTGLRRGPGGRRRPVTPLPATSQLRPRHRGSATATFPRPRYGVIGPGILDHGQLQTDISDTALPMERALRRRAAIALPHGPLRRWWPWRQTW